MKTYLLLSASIIVGILGIIPGYAAPKSGPDPDCKTLTVSNDLHVYAIKILYTKCGNMPGEEMLETGKTQTYSAAPNTKLSITMQGYTIWGEQNIGSGWTLGCKGTYMHPWCEAKPIVAPLDCKHFKVKHNGSYYLQPEFIECGTGNLLKPHLSPGPEVDYLVKPNTEIRIEKSTGMKEESSHIWPAPPLPASTPIGNGYTITCSGSAGSPTCTATKIP
jgi:hypothetical protein